MRAEGSRNLTIACKWHFWMRMCWMTTANTLPVPATCMESHKEENQSLSGAWQPRRKPSSSYQLSTLAVLQLWEMGLLRLGDIKTVSCEQTFSWQLEPVLPNLQPEWIALCWAHLPYTGGKFPHPPVQHFFKEPEVLGPSPTDDNSPSSEIGRLPNCRSYTFSPSSSKETSHHYFLWTSHAVVLHIFGKADTPEWASMGWGVGGLYWYLDLSYSCLTNKVIVEAITDLL